MPRGGEFADRLRGQSDAIFPLFDFLRHAYPHSKPLSFVAWKLIIHKVYCFLESCSPHEYDTLPCGQQWRRSRTGGRPLADPAACVTVTIPSSYMTKFQRSSGRGGNFEFAGGKTEADRGKTPGTAGAWREKQSRCRETCGDNGRRHRHQRGERRDAMLNLSNQGRGNRPRRNGGVHLHHGQAGSRAPRRRLGSRNRRSGSSIANCPGSNSTGG